MERHRPAPGALALLAWLAALAVVGCVLVAPAASSFSSLPRGVGAHDGITAEGAREAGYPSSGIAALQDAVVAPDLGEMEWDPHTGDVGRVDARGAYRGAHHCDRIPPAGHLESFNATVAHVQASVANATAASRAWRTGDAVEQLGLALHAAQDCASHSNAGDLGLHEGGRFAAAVLGDEAPPAGLWLTGFAPGAEDPEDPEGDPYPHGRFAKDSADGSGDAKEELPDGSTKFEAARAMAVSVTAGLLARFLANLTAEEAEALGDVEGVAGPWPKVALPGLGAVAAVAAAALLLGARRRARP